MQRLIERFVGEPYMENLGSLTYGHWREINKASMFFILLPQFR